MRSMIVGVILTTLSTGHAFAQEKEKDKGKPSDKKAQKVELAADLTAEAPAAWKFQKPNRPFRTHEFTLPDPDKGDTHGIMVITHFGKGGGGGLNENLQRWYKMVEQPDGGSTEKATKKEDVELKQADGKAVWLDMSGTYIDRPTPMSEQFTKRPNYRVFAVMIEAGKEGPYWIRAYGPESVMKAHRDGFESFLKSISKK